MREIRGIPIWGISEKGIMIEYGLYVLLLSFMIISGMKAICRLLINRGRQIKKRMQILSLIQCDTTPLLMSSKNTKRKKVFVMKTNKYVFEQKILTIVRERNQ